jgi:uncharacterized membrane protein YhaH (DUF805 family)
VGNRRSAMSTPSMYPSVQQPSVDTALLYLQGAPVSFGVAVKQGLRTTLVYRGRASRSAYWWFSLFQGLVGIALELILFGPLASAGRSGGHTGSTAAVAISFIILVPVFIWMGLASLAVTVRRLHDTDRSGWWLLLGLVPYVGGLTILIFTMRAATPGPNQFDP